MKDGGHWSRYPHGLAMGRRGQTTNSQLAIVMDMIAEQVMNNMHWRHLVKAQDVKELRRPPDAHLGGGVRNLKALCGNQRVDLPLQTMAHAIPAVL